MYNEPAFMACVDLCVLLLSLSLVNKYTQMITENTYNIGYL